MQRRVQVFYIVTSLFVVSAITQIAFQMETGFILCGYDLSLLGGNSLESFIAYKETYPARMGMLILTLILALATACLAYLNWRSENMVARRIAPLAMIAALVMSIMILFALFVVARGYMVG